MIDYEKMLLSIKSHIVNSGLELDEIAQGMGISIKTLKSYLSGKTKPRVSKIISLCELLNIKAQTLLGLDE